jgi:hypothetical protein
MNAMRTPGFNKRLYILPSIFEKAREAEQDAIIKISS